jgi:hypothetical protein
MRLKNESYGIDVGTLVMNYHHGLLRFGVVRQKRKGAHGWSYCKVDWLEDDIHTAKVAWDKKMGATKIPSDETRVDWLKPVSPQWLRNVTYAYRRYEDERRTENG